MLSEVHFKKKQFIMSSSSFIAFKTRLLTLLKVRHLAHQNRTIAIASDFRVDGAKSPEIPQNEQVLGSQKSQPEIANR